MPLPSDPNQRATGGRSDLSEGPSLDLRGYASMFWRRKWLFVACVVVLPVAAYFVASRNAKVYKATVEMEAQATIVDTSLLNQVSVPVPPQQSGATAARLRNKTAGARAAAQGRNPW